MNSIHCQGDNRQSIYVARLVEDIDFAKSSANDEYQDRDQKCTDEKEGRSVRFKSQIDPRSVTHDNDGSPAQNRKKPKTDKNILNVGLRSSIIRTSLRSMI